MIKVRKMLVPEGQKGAMPARAATYPPEPREEETVIFSSFIAAGLVPPFSSFFLEVLSEYQVHLVHLSPNSVLMLAIFAHLCEMFVGVMPSVALWRHFYVLRSSGKTRTEVVGSCNFRLRDGARDEYIPQELKNKWDDWRLYWCYLAVDPHLQLLLPEGPAMAKKRWEYLPDDFDSLRPVTARISALRAAGLTATMVVGDFVRRRLAPLRERDRPAWMYTGPRDIGRTVIGEAGDLEPDRKSVV